MKVVIDTNVIVSAALKDQKPEEAVLFVVEHPDFRWCAASEILAEYLDVLQRPKFALSADVIKRWSEVFRTTITVVDIPGAAEFPRDSYDAKFLACALAIHADLLITVDKEFSSARKITRTLIISVSQFLTIFRDSAKP